MNLKSRFAAFARVSWPEVPTLAEGALKCHEVLLLSFPNLYTPWRVEENAAGFFGCEEITGKQVPSMCPPRANLTESFRETSVRS